MTRKEKAEELYLKYMDALNIRDLQTTTNSLAKTCALIAVEEILECEPTQPNDADWNDCGCVTEWYWHQKKIDAGVFWNEVKSELNAL